jgi:uncharacterized surface protein with fasciclin (FAS1) repeats
MTSTAHLAATTADLVGIAEPAGAFTATITALNNAGLGDTLTGPGSLTVFAPTDEAFKQLRDGAVAKLPGDLPTLRNVLLPM